MLGRDFKEAKTVHITIEISERGLSETICLKLFMRVREVVKQSLEAQLGLNHIFLSQGCIPKIFIREE